MLKTLTNNLAHVRLYEFWADDYQISYYFEMENNFLKWL